MSSSGIRRLRHADVQRAARALAELVLWPLREHITEPRLVDRSRRFAAHRSVCGAALVGFGAKPSCWCSARARRRTLRRFPRPASARARRRPRVRSRCSATRSSGNATGIRNARGPPGSLASRPFASTRSMSGWAGSLPRLPATREEVLAIAAARKARRSREPDRNCTGLLRHADGAAESGRCVSGDSPRRDPWLRRCASPAAFGAGAQPRVRQRRGIRRFSR